jgi:hypothetical protein
MKRFARRIVFAGVFAALLPLSGLGQVITGTVTVRVADSSGVAVPSKRSTAVVTYGSTIAGPVWIQHVFNGKNKLFFFAADEFRPSNTVQNVGNISRLPKALRAGNFPPSLHNQGAPIPNVVGNTNKCAFPGQRHPEHPFACSTAESAVSAGGPYNYAEQGASYFQLLTQPVFHLDCNATSKLRFNAAFNEQTQRPGGNSRPDPRLRRLLHRDSHHLQLDG